MCVCFNLFVPVESLCSYLSITYYYPHSYHCDMPTEMLACFDLWMYGRVYVSVCGCDQQCYETHSQHVYTQIIQLIYLVLVYPAGTLMIHFKF